MAAHAIEQVEEDAADLQFPKDWLCVMRQESRFDTSKCYVCSSVLHEPYIRCAECPQNVEVCMPCFTVGAEIEPHENCHSYTVIRNEFPLYEGSAWSANEELELLDALLECGEGNWSDISRRMQTRSAQECQKHYYRYYIEDPVPELPQFPCQSTSISSEPYYECRVLDTDDPPRYLPGSSGYKALAGYNAARSDFEVEFDNHAEIPLSHLDSMLVEQGSETGELETALHLAIVDIYNARLKERFRRKKIIRDHGLILVRKTLSWLHRFETTLTRPLAERLLVFMQLMSGQDFDYVMEGLHHAGELRQNIFRLKELRENGITCFHSCRLYRKLLRLREMHRRDRRNNLTSVYSWPTAPLPQVVALPDKGAPVVNVSSRRPAPPLDIVGLPGYEKLSPAERQLCSTARLVPESYIEFQRLLMAECKRSNGLKLAQARTLIKIDVNKTRKLYDFLLKEGYIYQPS